MALLNAPALGGRDRRGISAVDFSQHVCTRQICHSALWSSSPRAVGAASRGFLFLKLCIDLMKSFTCALSAHVQFAKQILIKVWQRGRLSTLGTRNLKSD
jgi:hypothetical protein